MKRLLSLLAILLLIAGAWWGYTNYVAPAVTGESSRAPAGSETEQNLPQEDLENIIWASGTLVPKSWASLSPAVGGTVARILVAEGELVSQDDLLLELSNSTLKSEVEQARAALAQAQAARDRLLAGASAADIATARAQVAAAQAGVAQAEGRQQELGAGVDAAQAQLNIVRQQYNELASHPSEGERRAAEALLAVAQAGVNQAQAAYNLVRGDPNIAARPEARALQEATAALEAARAEYSLATQGATDPQLAVAQARIQAASTQVDVVRSQLPGASANVEAARAQVAGAQAGLERLLAGPTVEEIAIADADVRSAIASLASAHARLRQSQILAPFDGRVGAVHVRSGEQAMAGQPLILLGDTDHMHVETTDLRETDVIPLNLDLPVEVTFDALPDEIFAGVIARIAPVSTTEKGSTNYTVVIDVPDLDPRLRWGMTAFINIGVE